MKSIDNKNATQENDVRNWDNVPLFFQFLSKQKLVQQSELPVSKPSTIKNEFYQNKAFSPYSISKPISKITCVKLKK